MKSLFPVLLILFFVSTHYLCYTRVVLRLHVSSRARVLLGYLLILNMAAVAGYLASRYALSPPQWLYFAFSLSIGIGFVLFIGTVVYELFHLFQRYAPFSAAKRNFLKRSGDIAFLTLGSAYIGAGVLEGSKDPVIEFVEVRQNRFRGKSYRIVQISDMHVGGLIDQAFVAKSVAAINALDADLIAITGDLCDARIDAIQDAINELRHLKSRFGTYFVVGNHEYFHDIDATVGYLKTLGIHVLENSSVPVNGDFYVAGVNDLFGYRAGIYPPDIARSMQDIPDGYPTLLLAHQPKFVDYLESFTPALILSGHTHGGQIWPFAHLVGLVQPYVRGLHSLGRNRHIYINSGIGFWGPPMRLGSHAEITCISWS